MKNLIFCLSIILLSTGNLLSQSQPKLRYSVGFFNPRYELGDKDINESQVAAHLKNTSPDAYYQFKRAQSLQNQSLAWSLIGLCGVIVGVATDDVASIAGYGVGVVGFTGSLIPSSSSKKKIERAIDIYNRQNGY